ncbi:MAG: hypothetical protein R3284_09020 [Rubricoccaceae bacterium]|nr:hypothetical protein [Rubricoccaceae bacterium]
MTIHLYKSIRLVSLLIFAAALYGCDAVQQAEHASIATTEAVDEISSESRRPNNGYAVVANRGSGTISILKAPSGNVEATISLPQEDGEPLPEPMYVSYSAVNDWFFVGDRANSRVVAYNARDFSVEGTAPATGIFHMWADVHGQQLWVTDNVNSELTVIDTGTLAVLATVPVTGGTPHDVIVDPDETHAFATVFVDGGADQVVKYDTQTFTEVDRTDVGEDPHVAVTRTADLLYVPCQNTNQVIVLNRSTLDQEADIAVPGAHGAWMRADDDVFFTTNLPGGGTDGLFSIDTESNSVIASTDTHPRDLIPVPHNIVSTQSGRRLFVTHSGATSNSVSIYNANPQASVMRNTRVVTVGLNPFGIGFVPPSAP